MDHPRAVVPTRTGTPLSLHRSRTGPPVPALRVGDPGSGPPSRQVIPAGHHPRRETVLSSTPTLPFRLEPRTRPDPRTLVQGPFPFKSDTSYHGCSLRPPTVGSWTTRDLEVGGPRGGWTEPPWNLDPGLGFSRNTGVDGTVETRTGSGEGGPEDSVVVEVYRIRKDV